MTHKTKHIYLKYIAAFTGDVPSYEVQKVENTIEYSPGQILKQREVQTLCHKNVWRVHIS
jgi:hypothetical protein